MENNCSNLVRKEFKLRVIDESFNRIRICLERLNDENLNYSPDKVIPSVGNQVRHICGNIRQWMLASLGQEEDMRDRDSEFEERKSEIAELVVLLDILESDLNSLMDEMDDRMIYKEYHIQGFNLTGFSAIVHVIEHCSYHTGQITLLTKLITSKETGYYSNRDLNLRNS